MAGQPWDVPHLAAGSSQPPVDPDQVTVYNMRFCPFAERTILVLLAKKIPFKVININLKKKPEWFLEKTFGLVSVVLYKGDYIMESLINSDFLDELFPTPRLHPADPAQKAKDRLVVEVFGKMLGPFYRTVMAKTPEDRTNSHKEMVSVLEKIEAEFNKRGTKFFCGAEPGMLDYMIWPWFERLAANSLMFPEATLPAHLTGLEAWQKAMWTTEPVSQYGLAPEVLVRFTKEYLTNPEDPDYDMLLKETA